MALTRKQWNNIIILACVFIIAVLTFMDKKTHNVPSDAQLLFDDNAPLAQLQLDGIWLHKQTSSWECDPQVLNCEQWAKAWQGLRVSPLNDAPQPTGKPQELVIQITDIRQSQRWIYFPDEGVLKSPASNWYLVPPSLRTDLQPILDAKPAR